MNKNEKLNLYLDTLSTSERGVAERALALAASISTAQHKTSTAKISILTIRERVARIKEMQSDDEAAQGSGR